METRNVQLTGRQSYTITLPKYWILQHNIQKKQPLFMKSLSNGSLLIHPNPIEEGMEKLSVLGLDKENDPDYLFRHLLGAYLSGSTTFKIVGKGRFKPGVRETIKEFVNRLEALEITEETINSIFIKEGDFFSFNNFKNLYKTITLLVDKMMNDMIDTLSQRNSKNIENIINQDKQVNEVFWRVYHMAHLMFSIPLYVNFSLTRISTLYLIVLNIEQLGDKVVQFAKTLKELDLENINEKIMNRFINLFKQLESLLILSIDAVNNDDNANAHKLIKEGTKIYDECEQMFQICLTFIEIAIPLFKLIESVKSIARQIQNIGELTINFISASNS